MPIGETWKTQWALEFGALLRTRRRELELSQQAVADMAGIHRTLLSDYERESAPERTPTDDTIRGLAKALDLPDELLFEAARVPYPSVSALISKAAPPEMLSLLQELMAEVRSLSARFDRLEQGGQRPPRGRRPGV